MKQLLGVLAIVLSLAGAGCRQVDLATALNVTDVFTGWYHMGVVDGLNKLVPSFTFRLENVGDRSVNRVQLLVSFWQNGADGEIDSKQVTGIGPEDLPPSGSTDPLLVRSDFGYTLEQSEQELFQHTYFRDFTAKLFARSGGRLVPLGEFPIERRIIPRVTSQP
jgi:hypothetical protein